MLEFLTKFLQAFIPLFVAIDPVGLAAVFLALGHDVAPAVRHRIAWQATVTGGLVARGFPAARARESSPRWESR